MAINLYRDTNSIDDYSDCPYTQVPGEKADTYYGDDLKAQVFAALGELYYSNDL